LKHPVYFYCWKFLDRICFKSAV